MRPLTSPSHPVLLCGTDAEEDAREIAARSVAHAQELAAAMMRDESSEGIASPPWLNWTIWHNDPAREGEWCVHSSGPA